MDRYRDLIEPDVNQFRIGVTMREQSLTAVVTDKRKIETRYVDVLKPSLNDAILRVEACGCGSDYSPLQGTKRNGRATYTFDFLAGLQ